MIVLTDLAHKLEEILNSSNIASVFQFVVKSQGYHLDSIADQKTGKNTIPVFIGIAGGEYNAVPNLKQVNFNYSISIWFPIRFKESFYLLNEYLEETFVAKTIDIKGQKALCNISIAEYSEITDVHLDQFEEWVEDTYDGAVRVMKKEHDISEEYMAMTFNLYATTLGDGFSFGNDVKYEIECRFKDIRISFVKINNILYAPSGTTVVDEETYYVWRRQETSDQEYFLYSKENPNNFEDMKKLANGNSIVYALVDNAMVEKEDYVLEVANYGFYNSYLNYSTEAIISQSGTGVTVSPVAQQKIVAENGTYISKIEPKFAKNMGNVTNYNKSFVIYPKTEDEFWDYFLFLYNIQMLDGIDSCYLVKKYSDGSIYKTKQMILTAHENIQLGQPLSFTITLGDSI